MRQIIFVDIDGVLLSGAAWATLPRNSELQRRASVSGYAQHEVSAQAGFDPIAIAMLNRLAERAAAELVISSIWRYSVGSVDTRTKLIAEGIREELFHVDFACPLASPANKRRDILTWLRKHGNPDYVILDDEVIYGMNQVLCDPVAGFGVREYRDAATALGFQDHVMSAKR
ncbi:HAD domain-containing protein [Acidisphaera sp. S103]|uniref:HAD domain-containing protein n=1 Tax=Acidisphaera sp. S103 TaxID=1747223 RepID=UPI00131C785E|nr:HAD domain-containing protein [Acidisphaera sp. S103]